MQLQFLFKPIYSLPLVHGSEGVFLDYLTRRTCSAWQPLLVLCCLALAGLQSAAGTELLHSIELHPDLIVHWTPENETNSVTIRVEARTR